MKLNRWAWLFLSGGLWCGIGGWLLSLGAKRMLLAITPQEMEMTPLLDYFTLLTGEKTQAASLLIIASLLMGWFKGWAVLSKTVSRTAKKIELLPQRISLRQVYGVGYLFLIIGMMSLGMVLKKLHLPLEIHAMIDVAVGAALVMGAWLYFRCGYLCYRISKSQ